MLHWLAMSGNLQQIIILYCLFFRDATSPRFLESDSSPSPRTRVPISAILIACGMRPLSGFQFVEQHKRNDVIHK